MNELNVPTTNDRQNLLCVRHHPIWDAVSAERLDRLRSFGWLEPAPSMTLTPAGLVAVLRIDEEFEYERACERDIDDADGSDGDEDEADEDYDECTFCHRKVDLFVARFCCICERCVETCLWYLFSQARATRDEKTVLDEKNAQAEKLKTYGRSKDRRDARLKKKTARLSRT